MKNLKKSLHAVNKELTGLVKKTDSLMKAVDRIEKAQAAKAKKASPKKKSNPRAVKRVAAKKTPAKKTPAKTRPKLTATDKILNIINKSKKGVSVQALIKKTGFDQRKIANILFRVSKMGKIKSVSRGVYVGV